MNIVQDLFAKIDVIAYHYQQLKEKTERLPQSLLSKAFRGDLVEQDENDEPASVLLEKIQELKDDLSKKVKVKG